ncbi:hypothetical protein [Novosphingobium sp.]|uniref:hypothetical protein n=1 Tax=Novosphingobium sp. TaxID=1874826 RepID=UPI001DECB7EE|nr:hypothetical protein [Novosphingobium sp.]MBX9662399.1 hypothetical protein [Novosphingobium sp.]
MTPSAALRHLGLRAGADVPAIRKAYAALYKAMDPDADPEGYARLRQARDIALRAAKVAAAPPPPAEPEAPAEAAAPPPAPWVYGAPTVAIESAAESPLLNAGQVPHAEPVSAEPQPIQAPAASAAALRALAGPPLLESAEPPRAYVGYLAQPDIDLARLLHDPEADLAPLTDDQEAFAQRCLGALLTEAATADLTRHARIEDWLADLLAETWPRSAPLLRPAAEAFGWENERGQITERSSIAWLNARLRGLRFQDKVTEADHPLHKAWVELTRPGSATIVDKFRIKRADINQLLEGVRKHFPELENHFPRERVVSWGDGAGAGGKGFGVFRIFGTGFTFNAGYAISVVVGLQILMAVLRGVSPDPVSDQRYLRPPPAYTAATDPQFGQIRDAAVQEVFGKGKTIDWLRKQQPGLATDFEADLVSARSRGVDTKGAIANAVAFIRDRTLLDGRNASDDVLRQTIAVRLALLDAASAAGAETCMRVVRADYIEDFTFPDQVRIKERQLARSMAERGLLAAPNLPSVINARIPGALISKVIAATGLSERQVRDALSKKGKSGDQCKVTQAMLRAALKWPGSEADDILRVM